MADSQANEVCGSWRPLHAAVVFSFSLPVALLQEGERKRHFRFTATLKRILRGRFAKTNPSPAGLCRTKTAECFKENIFERGEPAWSATPLSPFVGRFASQAGNILNDRGNAAAAAEITLMESAYCFERGKVSTRFSFRVML